MKKIIICGLGAVGTTIGARINSKCELRILADEVRINKYKNNPPRFNNIEQNFKYIYPNDSFEADLIIISTKYQGLNKAIEFIKNFVGKKTIIISLLNGISSENIIKKNYPNAKVLKSYLICHSAMREGNSTIQDGKLELFIENDKNLADILDEIGLKYTIPQDIDYSMWLKFTLNLFSNQVSAILKLKFGEMKNNLEFIKFAKKIIAETKSIAEKIGIKNLENLEKDALVFLSQMSDDGKTSMYQDVLAKRETEVEAFAGEIVRLGKELGVETPYNQVMYDLIKIIDFEVKK